MIKQNETGLNSRSEANPYDENNMLPILTAPMYSVVDETNYQIFLDNKIQVCLPRKITVEGYNQQGMFLAMSLDEFINTYIISYIELDDFSGLEFEEKVCIDTANGNMPALHEAIIKAKEIHGNNLIIMSGNVSDVNAFVKLAKSGCDYIRVGIGGGGGCSTTSNVGVGQKNLRKLISQCWKFREIERTNIQYLKEKNLYSTLSVEKQLQSDNLLNVKIVADGISSYITHCQKKYNFNDNGYAAINTLLYAGADLVMIGKLFAQCLESAGDKRSLLNSDFGKFKPIDFIYDNKQLVKYSGMSTLQAQEKYKDDTKPSEGSVSWIPVRWTLSDWIKGNANQDEYPYLMGYENSLVSAKSYAGAKTLAEFKNI